MHILVVDDELPLRTSLVQYLAAARPDWSCSQAADGQAARDLLALEVFDIVLSDLRMPNMGGMELLTWLRSEGPQIPLLVMSAYGEVSDAVLALKGGADDYLVKPFNPAELVVKIEHAVERWSLRRGFEASRAQESTGNWVIGKSPAFASVWAVIRKAAPTTATVLITGESGTGKEVAARLLHANSLVKDGPFVPVNLGGIPESLLESELFGFEKGAFTGADRRKPGLFEMANGGTLFLDEIGDMPLGLQVKLLRVLQERTIQRLGGTQPVPINGRLIAATNRDLASRVAEGTFREDLYYRLKVITVHLPPLRERLEDIPALAGAFVGRISQRMARPVPVLSDSLLAALRAYRFPGNIRELENMLERALIMSEAPGLDLRDFPELAMAAGEDKGKPSAPGEPAGALSQTEKDHILQVLDECGGNRTQAAARLGIARRTLLYKLKSWGIKET